MNDGPGFSHRGGGLGENRPKNHIGAVPGAGRKSNRSETQNGAGNMTDDIEILHTDTLIKEVLINLVDTICRQYSMFYAVSSVKIELFLFFFKN